MTASVGLSTPTDLATARLVLTIAEGWTVTDTDGGALDTGRAQLTWDLVGIPAGSTISHAVRLLAPSISPVDGGPSSESTFAASLEQTGGTTAGPDLTVLVAPRIVVEHRALARIDPATLEATYLPIDTPITGQERFETFRIRFQLRNADDLPRHARTAARIPPGDRHRLQPLPVLDEQWGVPFCRVPGVDADRRGPAGRDSVRPRRRSPRVARRRRPRRRRPGGGIRRAFDGPEPLGPLPREPTCDPSTAAGCPRRLDRRRAMPTKPPAPRPTRRRPHPRTASADPV